MTTDNVTAERATVAVREEPRSPVPWARSLAAGVVALVAAWASYRHTVTVALEHHQPADIAYLMPFSVDGMMVVSSIVMVAERRTGPIRLSVIAAFAIGVVASILANGLAVHGGILDRTISAFPALTLVFVVEMLARRPKRKAGPFPPLPEAPVSPASVLASLDFEPTRPRTAQEWVTAAEAIRARAPQPTWIQVAEELGCTDAWLRVCRNTVKEGSK